MSKLITSETAVKYSREYSRTPSLRPSLWKASRSLRGDPFTLSASVNAVMSLAIIL